MKLIIQIPCFNEADSLPITISALPKSVPGFDTVEYLVIDDGSVDKTEVVARELGVHHIVKLKRNSGLARAFMAGIREGLRLGADVIVNTDADNQYCADDIPLLTEPITSNRADMVIGTRPIASISHFSIVKKLLQKLGSWVVRVVSNTKVDDAPSGFRAYSRLAASRMNVFSDYTYTLETIIQAGQNRMAILSVPIRVNAEMRPSRLVKSIFSYVRKSIATIIRIFAIYRSFRFFTAIAIVLFGSGFLIGLRFLFLYFQGNGSGNTQSLILAGLLMGMGFQTFMVAFIADLLSANRKILEEIKSKMDIDK